MAARSSYRADVAPLHEALHSPSPLGNILDGLHRTHSLRGSEGADDGRGALGPGPVPGGRRAVQSVASERSLLGAGSVASSAVATVVGGAHNAAAHWRVLCFGQLVSFFLAAAGAASEELNGTCRVSVPLTQTALAAGVLAILGASRMRGWCAGCRAARRGAGKGAGNSDDEEENFCGGNDADDGDEGPDAASVRSPMHDDDDEGTDGWASDVDDERPAPPAARGSSRPRSLCWGLQTVHAPWYLYFFAAFVAVQGRFLIFLAFRYTSFTFIYMIDALAIPSAMVFSKYLLGRSYRATHVLGGTVCIGGIVISTISDLNDGADAEKIGSRSDVDPLEHLWGDFVAIAGAVLLGLDDVVSELLIKNYGGEDELLFVKWFFGLGISVAQLVLLERDGLDALFENQGGEPCNISTRFILMAVYVAFQVLDIAGELRFLSISEAALLNLSLLTSDLWAAAFSIVAVGVEPSALYYLSLSLIFFGIVLYEAGPSPMGHSTPSDIKITIATDATNGKSMGGHVEMQTNGLI